MQLTDAVEFVVLAAAVSVLASGFAVTLRLRKRGGLENSLAHVVIDARKRKVFFWAISTFTAMFVLAGICFSVEAIGGVSDGVLDFVTSIAFAVGAVAVIAMMLNGLDTSDLSLQEELELRDSVPPVLAAVREADPYRNDPDLGNMYVVGRQP